MFYSQINCNLHEKNQKLFQKIFLKNLMKVRSVIIMISVHLLEVAKVLFYFTIDYHSNKQMLQFFYFVARAKNGSQYIDL